MRVQKLRNVCHPNIATRPSTNCSENHPARHRPQNNPDAQSRDKILTLKTLLAHRARITRAYRNGEHRAKKQKKRLRSTRARWVHIYTPRRLEIVSARLHQHKERENERFVPYPRIIQREHVYFRLGENPPVALRTITTDGRVSSARADKEEEKGEGSALEAKR